MTHIIDNTTVAISNFVQNIVKILNVYFYMIKEFM